MNKIRRLRTYLVILLLMVSCVLLAWGVWPLGTQVQTVPIQPLDMQIPTPESLLPAWLWFS